MGGLDNEGELTVEQIENGGQIKFLFWLSCLCCSHDERRVVWKFFPAVTYGSSVFFPSFCPAVLYLHLVHFFVSSACLLFSVCCCLDFPGLLLTSASKTPAAPSSADFLSFSDSSLRPGGGTTFSSPPSFSSCLMKPSSEGGASEGTSTLFSSLMSATTASAGARHLSFMSLVIYMLLL